MTKSLHWAAFLQVHSKADAGQKSEADAVLNTFSQFLALTGLVMLAFAQ